MTAALKKMEEQALSLPPEEREALADFLLQSLDKEPLGEIDQAWVEEAEKRYQDFRSGKTQGIPGEEVFEQIRRELGWAN